MSSFQLNDIKVLDERKTTKSLIKNSNFALNNFFKKDKKII